MANARKWSAKVTRESHALDLKRGVFAQSSPKRIAASLKRSAEASRRRKTDPYRSALSMIVFYINRAGSNLSKEQRSRLERAKDELRALFGRGIRKSPARASPRSSTQRKKARKTSTRQ